MVDLRKEMPLLARNEGVWEGWYRYYDARTGKLTDEHRSRLLCRFPVDGPVPYHQTNYYFWEDGKREVRDFPADYRDGRIWWDNELIKGWAAHMSPDDYNRSTCLNWVRQGEPDLYLYEMIQLSDDGKNRCRTWHRRGVHPQGLAEHDGRRTGRPADELTAQAAAAAGTCQVSTPAWVRCTGPASPPAARSAFITFNRLSGGARNITKPPPPAPDTLPA